MGLALASGAAHHGPWVAVQQAFQRQQIAAAAVEVMLRRIGKFAQAQPAFPLFETPDLLRRNLLDELRVLFLLIEDGHEPVLEPQVAGADDLAPPGVDKERLLAGEHRFADPGAVGEVAVERLHEAPGGLHEHAVAHGHDRGDSFFEELRGDGGGGVHFGDRGFAGFEEDQRNAVVADQTGEAAGVHKIEQPFLQGP